MHTWIVACCLILTMAPSAASESDEVMRTVHQFTAGFNTGNVAAALETCAKPITIVDEFPPYFWSSRSGCADWAAAYTANAKKHGITDGIVTIKKSHVDVTGDRAYVVTEAKYAWKERGVPNVEPASKWTLALHKAPAGWRIVAWTWSKI